MSRRPFRFLHAADLHLDQPISGLAEVPEQLLDTLIECPLLAAARVFDAALNHDVDFVVLAGGVLDYSRCAPHELVFLADQFQRLADHNIVVYWAENSARSTSECEASNQWPSNVRRFESGTNEAIRHEIDGEGVYEVVALTDLGRLPKSERDLFKVVMGQRSAVPADFEAYGINYWALSGLHDRSTPINLAHCVAHYPGTPQGRHLGAAGPHGCTLVTVDEQGHSQLGSIACDVVRWHHPKLEMESDATRADLERLLLRRTTEILEASPGITSLVSWTVRCAGPLFAELRRGKLANELLTALRAEFGQRTSPAWTIDISAELPERLPVGWRNEESLRGDFIRLVEDAMSASRHDGSQASEPILLHADLSPELLEIVGCNRLFSADEQLHHKVLGETAWLGAELLAPEDREP
jgi:DNA repair exonuclease SbcCD nuclease subunit